MLKVVIVMCSLCKYIWDATHRIFGRPQEVVIGLLNIEYFHKAIGIYGGYGMTSRNIAEHFNEKASGVKVDVLMARPYPESSPFVLRLDHTDLIVHSDPDKPSISNIFKYSRLLAKRNYDVLITTEYYSRYLYTLMLLPSTPLVLWIHDPRSDEELKKIATLSLESHTSKLNVENMLKISRYERESLRKLIKQSKLMGRKVVFASTANSLIAEAKKTYDLPDISPTLLPNPIHCPEMGNITFSESPSFCYLGRLDPIKRPWIYFELAKLFPDFDFYVAGVTHFKELMDPIIARYLNVKNLKFLGLVGGEEKDKLLKMVWAMINTSIHEALPVSFEEALAYGRPIISCNDADNLVQDYGYYTGRILGDGGDAISIKKFANGIEAVLKDRPQWLEKCKKARRTANELYSYENFFSVVRKIARK
jgi:glycosyltransferase involved in cell wall biosynthesis